MSKNNYYKHPKFGFVTTGFDGDIRTPIVRFAWPSLVTPKDPPPPKEGQAPGQPRYEVTGIMEPGDNEFTAKVNQMVPEMVALFNQGNKAVITLNQELYFQDGNSFDKEKYPYYADKKLIVARNAKAIKCFNAKREEIAASAVLGGMKGIMLVAPMITAHGLSFKLMGLQVIEDDGFRIGGFSQDVKSKFDDWSGTEVANPAEVAAISEPVPALEGKDAALNLL